MRLGTVCHRAAHEGSLFLVDGARYMMLARGLWARAVAARAARFGSAGLLFLAVAGCQSIEDTPGMDTATAPAAATTPITGETAGDVKYFASDEPTRLGVQRFNEGGYGLAEQYFRDAVEKAPKDVTAWIGLAASYDHLARFDLADRAYQSAIKLGGHTTQVLNNLGYSYLLRGDLKTARAKFQAALRRDPTNATIINNLQLLDSSSRYIARAPV